MADFVSSLNGVQMDAALIDMAEHNSEAYAVGERNGIPVGQGDVTYQNNARYYAQQAQSIAPASVTEAVRWDVAQTALTDANKAQARANIDAGKNGAWSNRNLLDNAYFVGGGSQLGDGVFPINQRGQSTYTGGGTQLDRWKTWEANDVITLTANGVKFKSPNGNGMFQYWSEFPTTKTVTFSAIIDGNIYSVTLPEGDTQYEYIGTGFKIGISRNGKCVYINSQNTEILIAACKLEVGTVSTLPNDPPPDFGEELQKCKRRFRFIPLKRELLFLAGDYNVAAVTLNGIEMASFPTASLVTAGQVYDITRGTFGVPTAAACLSFDYNTPTIQLSVPVAGDGVGLALETVISLSCEL